MHPLILAAAAAVLAEAPTTTKHRLFEPVPDPPARTATTAVTTAPANPVAAAAPIVVQFHEDAATKDDLRALADRIEHALQPIDSRLVAVERQAARTAGALDELRAKVERAERPGVAPTSPPPPRTQLWELYDITGIRCTGRDPDELSARVQQRDAYFTRKAAAAQAARSAPAYASYTSMPMVGFGGGFPAPTAPGSFGGGFSGGGFSGGFTGGGCAGGSCR